MDFDPRFPLFNRDLKVDNTLRGTSGSLASLRYDYIFVHGSFVPTLSSTAPSFGSSLDSFLELNVKVSGTSPPLLW